MNKSGRLRRVVNIASALIIVAALLIALQVHHPSSGIDVSVVQDVPGGTAPYRALVQVRRGSNQEIVAGHRAPATGHLVFHLSPGSYVLLARGANPSIGTARAVAVQVPLDHVVPATLHFHRRRARRR